MAIAPSDPKIIYAGSGEGLQRPDLSVGDGIYKSTDAGETWQHLGLRDGQQIPAIIVDPKDPNRVFAAVLGHPYGPNTERGVYRSTDGGQTWQRVLYKDPNTGAMDLAFDPRNPQTIYAVLWAARRPPWSVGNSYNGPGSGLFKSTDGGNSWLQLTKGLPTFEQGLGRIGLGVSPSDPNRIYAMVDAKAEFGGVYRSDDAGMSWRKVNSESRIWGRGSDFAEVKVDPRNPDVIYVANTSSYRSTDGGQNFTAIKGAPGGDDYHRIWINPENPNIILIASDQGATITVNGGQTWSSWYNQPTAQMYHVITDNRFPYWVCSGQQESGSACVASRGDSGAITFRDWRTVGTEEYGYVAPDPLNPNIIYGGKVTRYDWATTQTVESLTAALVHFLDEGGGLTDDLILAAAHEGEIGFVAEVLARHGGIVIDSAMDELLSGDAKRLMGVLRVAGASRELSAGLLGGIGDLLGIGEAGEAIALFDRMSEDEVRAARSWLVTAPAYRAALEHLGERRG